MAFSCHQKINWCWCQAKPYAGPPNRALACGHCPFPPPLWQILKAVANAIKGINPGRSVIGFQLRTYAQGELLVLVANDKCGGGRGMGAHCRSLVWTVQLCGISTEKGYNSGCCSLRTTEDCPGPITGSGVRMIGLRCSGVCWIGPWDI